MIESLRQGGMTQYISMLIHICAYSVCNQLDFNLADCVYRILILHNEIGMPELVLGTMERLHWILFFLQCGIMN